MWKKNGMSDNLKTTEEFFLPKENETVSVEKCRTISLLNVEGKQINVIHLYCHSDYLKDLQLYVHRVLYVTHKNG